MWSSSVWLFFRRVSHRPANWSNPTDSVLTLRRARQSDRQPQFADQNWPLLLRLSSEHLTRNRSRRTGWSEETVTNKWDQTVRWTNRSSISTPKRWTMKNFIVNRFWMNLRGSRYVNKSLCSQGLVERLSRVWSFFSNCANRLWYVNLWVCRLGYKNGFWLLYMWLDESKVDPIAHLGEVHWVRVHPPWLPKQTRFS